LSKYGIKILKYSMIAITVITLAWFLGWTLLYWDMAGFHNPKYIFGSTVVKEKNIDKLSVREMNKNKLIVSGYCGDSMTYPYKLEVTKIDKELVLGVFIRNPLVYPWLWRTVGHSKDQGPRYFEYLVDLPKGVDSIRWFDGEKTIWIRSDL